MEEVYRVDRDDVFSVETSREKYTADAVIFATGSKHRQLGVPGENDLLGRESLTVQHVTAPFTRTGRC